MTAEREYLLSVWVAMMVAPRLNVCEALLRGETVPTSALDPVWVARLAADPPIRRPRVSLADFASIPIRHHEARLAA